jgi:hypothetical protein
VPCGQASAGQRDAVHQLEQADDLGEHADPVDRAASRRELEREGQEEDAHVRDGAPVPGQLRERGGVEAAREELVRLDGITREQALQIFRRQVAGVGGEERIPLHRPLQPPEPWPFKSHGAPW